MFNGRDQVKNQIPVAKLLPFLFSTLVQTSPFVICLAKPHKKKQLQINSLPAKCILNFLGSRRQAIKHFENAEYYMSSSVSYLPKSGESDLPFDAAKVEIIFDLDKCLRNNF